MDATVAYNGSCKINGASAVLRARDRHELFKKRAIDAHLVRVDTGGGGKRRGMLKGPLYILPEEYRGQRQTFRSDIGIRCGGIGLSKISQGEHTRTFAGQWQTCRNSAQLQ